MVFLHFRMDSCGKHYEWGYESEHPPMVGDKVLLFVGNPDDDEADIEMLVCQVENRKWFYSRSDDALDEVEMWVVTNDRVPEGFVADSAQWPASEHYERKVQASALYNRLFGSE